MRAWMLRLLEKQEFTAQEAEDISGIYGPDAITRLRVCKAVKVTVIGDDGTNYKRKIYRLERSSNGEFTPPRS